MHGIMRHEQGSLFADRVMRRARPSPKRRPDRRQPLARQDKIIVGSGEETLADRARDLVPGPLVRTALPNTLDEALRPDQHLCRIAPLQAVHRTIADDGAVGQRDVAAFAFDRHHRGIQKIAFTDEAGDELVPGAAIKLLRGIELLDGDAREAARPAPLAEESGVKQS